MLEVQPTGQRDHTPEVYVHYRFAAIGAYLVLSRYCNGSVRELSDPVRCVCSQSRRWTVRVTNKRLV